MPETPCADYQRQHVASAQEMRHCAVMRSDKKLGLRRARGGLTGRPKRNGRHSSAVHFFLPEWRNVYSPNQNFQVSFSFSEIDFGGCVACAALATSTVLTGELAGVSEIVACDPPTVLTGESTAATLTTGDGAGEA